MEVVVVQPSGYWRVCLVVAGGGGGGIAALTFSDTCENLRTEIPLERYMHCLLCARCNALNVNSVNN